MSSGVVAAGDKLHIITRRLFADDVRRHFAGEVLGEDDGLFVVRGYAFVFQPEANEYRRRPELRTRIFALGGEGHIVNKLPRELEIDALSYQVVKKRLVVTDGKDYSLDINEFGPSS